MTQEIKTVSVKIYTREVKTAKGNFLKFVTKNPETGNYVDAVQTVNCKERNGELVLGKNYELVINEFDYKMSVSFAPNKGGYNTCWIRGYKEAREI